MTMTTEASVKCQISKQQIKQKDMNNSIRQSIKYWYMQKDVDCFLHSFYYVPFNSNITNYGLFKL